MRSKIYTTLQPREKVLLGTQKGFVTNGSATIQDNRQITTLQRKLKSGIENIEQGKTPIQQRTNNTGLPTNLKSGIENLSGYSMDDVKVHYNSSKPAQLQAHAYAQGTNIHLAPGQEKHLPHEAWHVVQQKQGRVQPTMQLKGKVNINDNRVLEKEADVMGEKALEGKFGQNHNTEAKNSSFQSKDVIKDRFDVLNNRKGVVSDTVNTGAPIQLKINICLEEQFAIENINQLKEFYVEWGGKEMPKFLQRIITPELLDTLDLSIAENGSLYELTGANFPRTLEGSKEDVIVTVTEYLKNAGRGFTSLEYRYHVTKLENLPSIRKDGLVPPRSAGRSGFLDGEFTELTRSQFWYRTVKPIFEETKDNENLTSEELHKIIELTEYMEIMNSGEDVYATISYDTISKYITKYSNVNSKDRADDVAVLRFKFADQAWVPDIQDAVYSTQKINKVIPPEVIEYVELKNITKDNIGEYMDSEIIKNLKGWTNL
ncbi:DUF4157 domain-containing protein [Aquimarina litoralis]|uniref:eCIS core domain-containing protein n=1 Tax=Aquimarina litoralis TaxID=584605 RepID=UPI001C56F094|nr:DUF4157 domain-containing protein [Aquimarina litoralis]